MDYVPYVHTKDADSLTVRNAPLGEKIEYISNGTQVKVQVPTVKEKDIMTNFIQTEKPKHFIFNDG